MAVNSSTSQIPSATSSLAAPNSTAAVATAVTSDGTFPPPTSCTAHPIRTQCTQQQAPSQAQTQSQIRPHLHPTPEYIQVQQQQQRRRHNSSQFPSPHQNSLFTAAQTHQTLSSRSQLAAAKTLHQEPIRYPLATSGRGFVPPKSATSASTTASISTTSNRPMQLPDQALTPANSGAYPPRPILSYSPHLHVCPAGNLPSFISSHPQNALNPLILPPSLHSSQTSVSAAPPARGIHVSSHSHPKIGAFPCSIPDGSGPKEIDDRAEDDAFLTIRDRKVRISEEGSIYALCRSWLRHGYPDHKQPHCADAAKSLPKPLPLPVLDTSSPRRKEPDDEEDMYEDEKSVENLKSEELLQRHIKRAKKVRARLREERLQRIARYKSRLALLLPPLMEQCGNDASAGIT